MIFSTVTNFYEQVGRRKAFKYGELDQLVCVYTGPSNLAQAFDPPLNSRHPDYPLMFVTDSEIVTREALVSEVTVTYQGKILTGGQTSYVGPPFITESNVQGSRDFMLYTVSPVYFGPVITGQGPTGVQNVSLNDVGTQTVTVRYIGQACSVRYQAYPLPANPQYSSLGKSKVKWSILSEVRGQMSIVAHGVTPSYAAAIEPQFITAVPPLFAAYFGMQVEQIGNWYNVTETYGPTF